MNLEDSEPVIAVKPVLKKKRGSQRLTVFLLAFTVLGCVVASFFINSTSRSALEVSNLFLNSVQAGDAPEAYKLFSDAAKEVVDETAFTSLVKSIAPILRTQERLTGKTLGGMTNGTAIAEIRYEVDGTDYKLYDIVINLTKESDDWKVLNFDSKVK